MCARRNHVPCVKPPGHFLPTKIPYHRFLSNVFIFRYDHTFGTDGNRAVFRKENNPMELPGPAWDLIKKYAIPPCRRCKAPCQDLEFPCWLHAMSQLWDPPPAREYWTWWYYNVPCTLGNHIACDPSGMFWAYSDSSSEYESE